MWKWNNKSQEEIPFKILERNVKDLNALTKIIRDDAGRQMIDLLAHSSKGMYKAEITKQLPLTDSGTSRHLDNAEKAGFIEKSYRKICGIMRTHYRIPPQILIIHSYSKEELKDGSIEKTIKDKIKFTKSNGRWTYQIIDTKNVLYLKL